MYPLDQRPQTTRCINAACREQSLRRAPLHILRINPCPRIQHLMQPAVIFNNGWVGRHHIQYGAGSWTCFCWTQIHMPPQPPCPLDHRPDRGKISNHQVKIKIERGFNHLCRHQNPPCPAIPITPERGNHPRFGGQPVTGGKAGVQQIGVHPRCTQQLHRGNRIIHRIADP